MDLHVKAKVDFSFTDGSNQITLASGEQRNITVSDVVGGWLQSLAAKDDGPIEIDGVEKVDLIETAALALSPDDPESVRQSLQVQSDLRSYYLKRKSG